MNVQRQDLDFSIAFHSPFRVASGQAGGGLDATVNLAEPLPGSSLKGLMLDASRRILGAPVDLINDVFGTSTHESPWAWSSAVPAGGEWRRVNVQARVAIDDRTHTAAKDMIVLAEVVEQASANFSVLQRIPMAPARYARHRALIRAAAAAVHHLGSDRRRGLGWVTISDSESISAAELDLIVNGGSDA